MELFQVALDHVELDAEFTLVWVLFGFLLVFFDLESSGANYCHLILAILVLSLDLKLHFVFLVRDYWLDTNAFKIVDNSKLNVVWMLVGEELSLLRVQILIDVENSISFSPFVFITSHSILVSVIDTILLVGELFLLFGSLDLVESLLHVSVTLLCSSLTFLHPFVGIYFRHSRPVVGFQLEHALNEVLE